MAVVGSVRTPPFEDGASACGNVAVRHLFVVRPREPWLHETISIIQNAALNKHFDRFLIFLHCNVLPITVEMTNFAFYLQNKES